MTWFYYVLKLINYNVFFAAARLLAGGGYPAVSRRRG
jgi:hypothetical protein